MISIGLPCYNARATLPDTLRSVFAQTCPDWELLIVDDGSTDGSLDELRRLHDPRVRLFADGQNRHLAARLNQIARAARGEYLFRLDADDLMFPDRLERQAAALAAAPDCDLLGGAIVCIDAANRPLAQRCPPLAVAEPRRILRGEVLYHPTVCGRTEWFRAHPYDESYPRSQDFELWCRAAGELRIRNLAEPVLFYREYGGFSWGKYRRHSVLTKQILRRHGPARIGWPATLGLLAGRTAKDAVYAALALSGRAEQALTWRNRPLAAADAERYAAILAQIAQTPLPFAG